MPLCSGDPTPLCPPVILHLSSGQGSAMRNGIWLLVGEFLLASSPFFPLCTQFQAPEQMNLLYISNPKPPEVLQGAQPQRGAGGAEGPIRVSLLKQESNRSLLGWCLRFLLGSSLSGNISALEREAAILFETHSSLSSIKGKTDIMMLGQATGTSISSLNVSEEHIIWV